MDSNTHSIRQPTGQSTRQAAGPSVTPSAGLGDGLTARPSSGLAAGLAALTAAVDQLAVQDLDGLPDATRAERILRLRRLLDRLEGHWLAELAAVDALGAAGADQGIQAASTASWLRTRLRMGPGAASTAVRTARALFRGPLTRTGQARTNGEVSVAHASVLAAGTQDLAAHTTSEPNRCCWRRPGGWTHPGCAGSSLTCS